MLRDTGCDVPTKPVGAEIRARRTEVHQMTLRIVVPRVSTIKYAAVRRDHWRRRRIVQGATAAGVIQSRINAEICAGATTTRLSIRRQYASRTNRHTTTVS